MWAAIAGNNSDRSWALCSEGCPWTAVASNDRVVIIIVVIIHEDLEGVVVLCETLVYDW